MYGCRPRVHSCQLGASPMRDDVDANRYGPVTISKSREAKVRPPAVSQPPMKNTLPVSLRWPGAAPGDMNDGYQPSTSRPLPSCLLQPSISGADEFRISRGWVQSCFTRLVAVE